MTDRDERDEHDECDEVETVQRIVRRNSGSHNLQIQIVNGSAIGNYLQYFRS